MEKELIEKERLLKDMIARQQEVIFLLIHFRNDVTSKYNKN